MNYFNILQQIYITSFITFSSSQVCDKGFGLPDFALACCGRRGLISCGDDEVIQIERTLHSTSGYPCSPDISCRELSSYTICDERAKCFDPPRMGISQTCDGKQTCRLLHEYIETECSQAIRNTSFSHVSYRCIPKSSIIEMCRDSTTHWKMEDGPVHFVSPSFPYVDYGTLDCRCTAVSDVSAYFQPTIIQSEGLNLQGNWPDSSLDSWSRGPQNFYTEKISQWGFATKFQFRITQQQSSRVSKFFARVNPNSNHVNVTCEVLNTPDPATTPPTTQPPTSAPTSSKSPPPSVTEPSTAKPLTTTSSTTSSTRRTSLTTRRTPAPTTQRTPSTRPSSSTKQSTTTIAKPAPASSSISTGAMIGSISAAVLVTAGLFIFIFICLWRRREHKKEMQRQRSSERGQRRSRHKHRRHRRHESDRRHDSDLHLPPRRVVQKRANKLNGHGSPVEEFFEPPSSIARSPSSGTQLPLPNGHNVQSPPLVGAGSMPSHRSVESSSQNSSSRLIPATAQPQHVPQQVNRPTQQTPRRQPPARQISQESNKLAGSKQDKNPSNNNVRRKKSTKITAEGFDKPEMFARPETPPMNPLYEELNYETQFLDQPKEGGAMFFPQ